MSVSHGAVAALVIFLLSTSWVMMKRPMVRSSQREKEPNRSKQEGKEVG